MTSGRLNISVTLSKCLKEIIKLVKQQKLLVGHHSCVRLDIKRQHLEDANGIFRYNTVIEMLLNIVNECPQPGFIVNIPSVFQREPSRYTLNNIKYRKKDIGEGSILLSNLAFYPQDPRLVTCDVTVSSNTVTVNNSILQYLQPDTYVFAPMPLPLDTFIQPSNANSNSNQSSTIIHVVTRMMVIDIQNINEAKQQHN